ncbi:pleckstrin homology domain-containing family G member 6-like isoform X2 [Paramacrobiotus metropolitanus]|uniref:pleckstrin homology domain-containing family G member 6-like isoform X2 n=1 Tax=Paramacrobiotus metropolitanus TaxID=2943436 RepID=UPI00244564CD|nr:pleckstrin homology domain-containing family G member 6-like isoform X2 [Paramacrobiotus metropolitanus]
MDDPGKVGFTFPWVSRTKLLYGTLKYWEHLTASDRPPFPSHSCTAVEGRLFDNQLEEWSEDQRWTDFVSLSVQENMDDVQKGQQEAIWELISTERRYIERLEILRDFWRPALEEVYRRHDFVITPADLDKIFGCLSDVYTAQKRLWHECFSAILAQTKSTGLPLNPGLLKNGFLNMKTYFTPYVKYCSEFHQADNHLKKLIQANEYLGIVLEWCKEQPQSERQPLNNWLFVPVNRITKYSLLLSAILKKTADEHHRQILRKLISKIDQFVKAINRETWEIQEKEKLDAVSERIIMYDIFVSPSEEISEVLKKYVSTNFLNKFQQSATSRRLFLRELKNIRVENLDDTGKWIGTHLILFSDIMLVCRQIRINGVRRLKITRPVIQLSQLQMHPLRKPGSYLMVITDPALDIAYDGFVVSPTGKADVVINFIEDTTKAKKAVIEGATVLLDTVSDRIIAGATQEFPNDDDVEEEDPPEIGQRLASKAETPDEKGQQIGDPTPVQLPNGYSNPILPHDSDLSVINAPETPPDDDQAKIGDVETMESNTDTVEPKTDRPSVNPKLIKVRSITIDGSLLDSPTETTPNLSPRTPIFTPKFQSQEDVSLLSIPNSPAINRFSSNRNSQDLNNQPKTSFFDMFRMKKRHSDIPVQSKPNDPPTVLPPGLARNDTMKLARTAAIREKKKAYRKSKSKTVELNKSPRGSAVFYDAQRRRSLPQVEPLLPGKSDSSSESSTNVSRNESINKQNELPNKATSKNLDIPERPLSQNSSSGVETLSRPETPTQDAIDTPDAFSSPLPSPSTSVIETDGSTVFLTDATLAESSSDKAESTDTAIEYTLQIPTIRLHLPISESADYVDEIDDTDDTEQVVDIHDNDELQFANFILDKERMNLSDEEWEVTRV